MNAERWRAVDELFQQAITLPRAEQTGFLQSVAGDDEPLRREVEALLESDAGADGELEQLVQGVAAEWADHADTGIAGQKLGRYEVLSRIGSGGMGDVYLARDTTLDRKVALKLLPPQFTRDPDRLRRFEKEARAASALNHPNILTVYEIGECDGTRFIATEFIEGETLWEVIGKPLSGRVGILPAGSGVPPARTFASMPKAALQDAALGGRDAHPARDVIARARLPLDQMLDIGCQAAGALAAAHKAGIVHRDIKPANIMLRADGFVKVLDFGLAKLTSAAPQLDVTDPGRVMGTINYMSPEQAMGQPLDHRTDIFSLGVVLYELATGQRLFEGKSDAAVYNSILNQPLPTLADAPPALEQVLRRALAKDPAERYQTANDFRADLGCLARGSGETEATRAALSQKRVKRRQRALAIAAALALLLTLGAVFFFGGRMSGRHEAVVAAPPAIPTKSIAVMPFIDLSAAKDQESFSDGVAEEILNALSQVKDLKVAGRTSSFSFKGKSADARTIGAALGVAHILEGSIRKQGDKIRISTQLVQTSDGFRLWAENYEGELRDVFQLQELIARAMLDQLQVVLRGDQNSRLVKAPTSNVDAYSLYLQATAIFNRRESARFPEAISQLEEAVRLDPKFARAHARAALIHSLAPVYDASLRESAAEATVREVRRARELDPTLAEPGAALGQMLLNQRRRGEALAAYKEALALDPDDINTAFWLAIAQNSFGYLKESAAGLDKMLAKDPLFPNGLYWRGRAYQQMGQLDDAERILRRGAEAGLPHAGLVLSEVERARGRKTEAADWLTRGMESFMRGFPPGSARVIADGIYGGPAEREKAVALVDQYLAGQPPVVLGVAPFALICLGQPARGLAIAADKPTSNDSFVFPFLWGPAGRVARILPEFSEFARRSGLAELWDVQGPPDQCRKNPKGDYVCE